MDGHTPMHTSIMCPVHVHYPKILQNWYNNVQEWYRKILTNLKYLLYTSEKKSKGFKETPVFAKIIIHQHCAEVYTILASGMTHSKFISNKINVDFRFIYRMKNTDKNVLYCILYLYRV
jgi:hypothetical protein